MSASQRYAQARAETENVIENYAPKPRQQQLLQSLLPAIGLKARRSDDNFLPVGNSKFGGRPDVPSDFEWPFWAEVAPLIGSYPLSFFCQINLADVAVYDLDNLLPKTGTLSFFLAHRDGGDCAYSRDDRGGWRVYYFDEQKLERKSWPQELDGLTGIGCGQIEAVPIWTKCEHEADATLTEEESQQEYAFISEWCQFTTSRSMHWMFGHPEEIQDDPRYFQAEPGTQYKDFKEKDDWLLLLQISSDDEIDFDYCDNGTIYFVVHKDDLAARRFENVVFEGQQ